MLIKNLLNILVINYKKLKINKNLIEYFASLADTSQEYIDYFESVQKPIVLASIKGTETT